MSSSPVFQLCAWTIAVLLVTLDGATSLKSVGVNKCCSMDEYASKEMNYTCVAERKMPWSLTRIFSMRNKSYLPVGEVPRIWDIRERQLPQCDGGAPPKIFQYVAGSYLAFVNGSLFIVEYSRLVHPGKYCMDHEMAMVCPEEIQPASLQSGVHVKKCCGDGGVYSETRKTCIAIKNEGYRVTLPQEYALTFGFPACNDRHMVIAGKLHEATLLKDGGLVLNGTGTTLPAEGFCLEHVFENAGPSPSIFACHVEQPYVVQKTADLRFTLYPIGLALSAVFLAATLIAGSLLPASHHVLHWRCQTNHVACLLVADVLLCIVQLSGDSLSGSPCFIIAVAMHFLFLSAFFWLNTMCFNIWWTFRDLRPQSLEKSQERWRLHIYEVYAWGVPLLIAGTAGILDSVETPNVFITPGFAESNCWFRGNTEILTYFFGPVGGLLIINLLLFAATARELTCGLWKRELVKSTTERAALGRVCMKLVVVMGVTWIADVVSWAVGGPHEIWYVTDLINCLQGVFIFIVVGLQPQVLTAVKRLWCLRKNRAAETAGTTNHHSSSSQGLPSMGDTITNNSITNGTTKTVSVPLETSC